ncbi:MAG TPA: nicotinate-nucleotide adenylyltransferase [Rudaea sp.]|nr:nicotinate-nucleotide adenylyltransferase [Rudaea sp.]
MNPIAILGGTFDPVHIGHLRVAWEAAEGLGAQVRLMPAHVPPHRPPPQASAEQRVRMLELSLIGQDRLILDTRELRRDGPSYSVDTLRELRSEVGSAQSLTLLLGADAFVGLPSWHRWRELFDLAHLVVLTRPGHEAQAPAELVAEIAPRRVHDAQALQCTPAGHVFDLRVSALEISSSMIRERLARGHEPRWLLADALLAQPELLDVYRRPT